MEYGCLGFYIVLNVVVMYLIAGYLDTIRLRGYTLQTMPINIKIKYLPLILFLPAFIIVLVIVFTVYICNTLASLFYNLLKNKENSFVNKSIFKRNIEE